MLRVSVDCVVECWFGPDRADAMMTVPLGSMFLHKVEGSVSPATAPTLTLQKSILLSREHHKRRLDFQYMMLDVIGMM
jgi:hypothetical protein